jgi:hypothetical protein
MKQALLISIAICAVLCGTTLAQNNFVSGSTGADGAFAPTQSMTVQVPASGVFNYTTVTIPFNITVTYTRNASNTPVTILASGDVRISGTISLNGQPGTANAAAGAGGPGGSSGGIGGVNVGPGNNGDGPGGGGGGIVGSRCGGGGGGGYQTPGNNEQGGSAVGGQGGATYGAGTLVPLVGGSGGGGGCAFNNGGDGGGGGGGGGAILIATSTQIVFPAQNGGGFVGIIQANGGNGGNVNGTGSGGGAGSGGAIRLVANNISGQGQLLVSGGSSGGGNDYGGSGGLGFVRMEAFNQTGFIANAVGPSSPISSGLPGPVNPASFPSVVIASVAGVAAPGSPAGSFDLTPDIVLPANQANPVTVVVNATNIPAGSTVTVTAIPSTGAGVTASGTLSGTTTSSTASVSISLPSSFSVLTASTTAIVADNRPLFFNGERVDKIEVASRFGGNSEVTYITHSGRRVRAVRQ